MAHTLEDLVIEIADKYSTETTEYFKHKEMLWEMIHKLHNPIYIDKLSQDNYKEI